ncbi:hypothetical protein OIO90_004252 [Microbotryomycetes sp. JL221]|nr:hypothetical protein OIO90_004252 [Microbotryomycetes sp. JL221]
MTDSAPWHAAFPSPKSQPDAISHEQLYARMTQVESNEARDFVVVDVRRTDFEASQDSMIKGAINLPAHSFYETLDGVVPVLSRYKDVIFHCQSSNGRGPRCAGWYQDALNERGITTSNARILTGGIKLWRQVYANDKVNVELSQKSSS